MWTVDDVLALRPCKTYGRDRLSELWAGRESLGIGEVCDLDIPAEDKIWLLTKAPFEVIEPAIDDIVGRAVRNYALCSVIDEWAQKWLSGEDRTGVSANTAVACAWAATRAAAWAAAYAVAYATSASADAAAYAASASADAAAYADAVAAERELQVEDFRALVEEVRDGD